MGITGCGKTTFVNLFSDRKLEVGHGLDSCKSYGPLPIHRGLSNHRHSIRPSRTLYFRGWHEGLSRRYPWFR